MEYRAGSDVRRISQQQTQRTTRLVNVATIDRLIENTHQTNQSPILYVLGVLKNAASEIIDPNADQVYDTWIGKLSP